MNSAFMLLLAAQAVEPSSSSSSSSDPALRPLIESVGASVVRLAIFQGEEQRGNGTGFLVRADGIVITNHHVAKERSGKMFAVFRDGTKVPVVGSLALDEDHDLAILKIEGNDYPVLELAATDSITVGERLLLIGSAMGFDGSVGIGICSALRPDGYPEEIQKQAKKARVKLGLGPLLQHTVTAAPGASGSPIVDESGRVVGVHHSGWGDSEINFAAHVDAVRALMKATDLEAKPKRVGADVTRNLLISAAVFGGAALVGLVISKLVPLIRRGRRKRVVH